MYDITTSINNKIPLNKIAAAIDCEMRDLLIKIEEIVNSGIKIDIDYHISKVMDKDCIDDILAYFKEEAMSDSTEHALEELGEDYSEEEVMLIKIKFLSDFGN